MRPDISTALATEEVRQSMDQYEINRMQERIWRLNARLKRKAGEGAIWKAKCPDDKDYTHYHISKINDPMAVEDDIVSLAIQIWSMKDYLKEHKKSIGRNPQEVENFINGNAHLPICADIANSEKHGKLKESRSNKFCRLSSVVCSVPQQAIASLNIGSNSVGMDVKDPSLVTYTCKVVAFNGEVVGDAFEILDQSIEAWEEYITSQT